MKKRSEVKADRVEVEVPHANGKASPENKKKAVEELSNQLSDELNPKPLPFEFPTANPARKNKINPELQKIVETVFINDLHGEWQKLKEALKIGEKRSDHGTLHKELDYAETRAYRAHRLYLSAKLERDRWERENEVMFGAFWSEATRSLQKEKDDNVRSKQITDADVKARCATLFPDDYQAQELERAKVKGAIDSMEDLSEEWKSRCRTLQTMMGKLR